MDESPEQTELVLNAESERDDKLAPELEEEARIWRAAQTIIENHDVLIPYSKKLVAVFPKDKVRVRRDFPRFLSLIKVHTLLFQFQRERDDKGRLISTKEDLEAVLPIAEAVLVQSHKEVSPKLERVLRAVEENFGVNQEFSFGEVEKKVEFKERTLRNYLKSLTALDFLSHNGKTGKESRYVLLSPLASIASISNFGAKCRKLFENLEAKSDSPQSASSTQDGAEETGTGNEANTGKNGSASKNTNDGSGLDSETSSEAKRQGESNNASHSEDCDCSECCAKENRSFDFSGEEMQADSETKRFIYKAGDGFEVVTIHKDGKKISELVFPNFPAYESIRREYEQRSR